MFFFLLNFLNQTLLLLLERLAILGLSGVRPSFEIFNAAAAAACAANDGGNIGKDMLESLLLLLSSLNIGNRIFAELL
jgi:hypothetical protein